MTAFDPLVDGVSFDAGLSDETESDGLGLEPSE
jgi:hypothetical protein